MLEELGHAEEEVSTLVGTEVFANGEQIYDLGQQDTTFPWRDGALIEYACFLEDGCPVDIGVQIPLRVFILLGVRHACQG